MQDSEGAGTTPLVKGMLLLPAEDSSKNNGDMAADGSVNMPSSEEISEDDKGWTTSNSGLESLAACCGSQAGAAGLLTPSKSR